ncbi:MAG: hypothetical protein ACI9XO_002695 [Paraglaciecola sp.]|jgi:hypothetical protein
MFLNRLFASVCRAPFSVCRLLILLLPTFLYSQEVIPYPDNSPLSKDFEAMGISSMAYIWQKKEYQVAFDVLNQIYEADKFSLPRMESEYSGEMYKRLTALENFDFITDKSKNIGKRIIEFEYIKEIPFRTLIYYIEDYEQQERFGREVLECFFVDLFVYNAGMELYAELDNQLGEYANQGTFRKGIEVLQLEFNNKINLFFNVFEQDYYRYSERDLLTFANKLYFLLPKISDAIYRKQLKFRLKSLENGDFSPKLLQILKELKQEL